jgi:hypothetical protein
MELLDFNQETERKILLQIINSQASGFYNPV